MIKFKFKDAVCLEKTPTEKLTIAYIQGNVIHCTDSNNRHVVVNAAELIKYVDLEISQTHTLNLN